jgi:hypothetical protein
MLLVDHCSRHDLFFELVQLAFLSRSNVLKGLVNSILVVLFVVVSLLLLLLLVPVKQATSLTLLIFLDIPEGSSCSIPLDFF